MPSYAHATCNAQKELDADQAAKVVELVAAEAVVVRWQEIETDGHRKAVRELDDLWRTYWPSGAADAVPISWRADLFDVVVHTKVLIHKGQAGVTPNRYVSIVVLRERATGLAVPVLNTHLISKPSRASRRARWMLGNLRVTRQTNRLARKWGAAIGGGDTNRKWSPRGSVGVWAGHGTHGAAYLDVLWFKGKVRQTSPARRLPTPSDHDALVCDFHRIP